MKKGAFDYVTKPFKHEEVLHILQQRAATSGGCRTRTAQLRTALRGPGPLHRDRGQEPAHAAGLQPHLAGGALALHHPGGGRERHGQGAGGQGHPRQQPARRTSRSWWSTPGSLPHDLLESNLFGHVKGAFTGAVYAEEGPLRAGRQGHALLRRDRQHPARDAGQAAARDAGARVHAPGRRRTRSRSTCASWPPPTSTCAARSRKAASARTSTTA